jgi:ABC-type dipeptide/oligopeptide/nickel transport system permease component
MAPGDPARRILQAQGIVGPTTAEIDHMREALSLDRPFLHQDVD